MNHASPFAGVWCPSVTPLNSAGQLDLAALEQHLQRLEQAGTSVILLMGSIGEFPSLTLEERLTLIRAARKMTGRPMVANVSSTCVPDMLRLADAAYESGYDAVMVLPHYYFQQTPHQLLAYYRALGKQLAGRWFAYNFPARTGCDLDAPLVAQLVQELPGFVGIKDTVDCQSHTRAIIQATQALRPDFAVLSGYDEYLIPNLLAGGAGVISGLNNVVPALFVQVLEAWRADDLPRLRQLQREIGRLSAIYSIGNDFVTTIKCAVARRFGYMGELSRNSGGALTAQEHAQIDTLFAGYGV